jgi:hypothetical protein
VSILGEKTFVLARWLFLAAVLALAPQLAVAHGGHDHGDQPVSQPAGADGPADTGQAQAQMPAAPIAWSKSCPGGSGGKCCCGSTAVSPVSGTIPVVHAGGWSRPAPLCGAEVAPPAADALLHSHFVHSTAFPRAPPLFS